MESGQEDRIVQIDFSAAFDGVNYQGIVYKLCSLGNGGSVVSLLTKVLSNQSQLLWWTVAIVNWPTSCQECCRVVLPPVIVPPVSLFKLWSLI